MAYPRYPMDFLDGSEGEEFADPEYVLQFKPVPPPPLVPVKPPTPLLPSAAQDALTQGKLDFLDFMDTIQLERNEDVPEEWGFMDSSEMTGHGTKRATSEHIEAALFEDPSESSSPKRKKVLDHRTTANQYTAHPSDVPVSITNINPVINLDRQRRNDKEDKPYTKKPPNAFMLFRAEQRPNVVKELNITDSAMVNMVLGQRWKMLSEQEQAPYYEQALREKRAHEAKYPGWSTKDNFDKKRKNNGLPALTIQQQFAVPVASTHQQTSEMRSNTAYPMSFNNQAVLNPAPNIQVQSNQALYIHAPRGWEVEENRPVPAPPLAPPNDPNIQAVWEETQADLTRFVEAELAKSVQGILPDAPEDKELMDSSETIACGTKRDAHHQTTNQYMAQPSYVPSSTPNGNPVTSFTRLTPFDTVGGKQLSKYTLPASSVTSATSSQRKLYAVEDKPYIKKPPNAFMLFRAEQRPKVVQELNITDSAMVNMVLGQRWKMLSEQEQAPYYKQALREKRAHEAKYPGWSTKDNFGKKAKKSINNTIPVLKNENHQPVPVAPIYQQTVMWSNPALNNQAHNSQASYDPALHNQVHSNQALNNYALQNQATFNQAPNSYLPVETFMPEAIPVQAIPLETFIRQALDNGVDVQVLQSHTGTSALENQALPNQALFNPLVPSHAHNNQILSN